MKAETGYPATWWSISHEVKKRAKWKCENCGSRSVRGKILTVHHLDMNPQNNTPENLVALCQACHLSIQAHFKPGQGFLLPKPNWMKRRGL